MSSLKVTPDKTVRHGDVSADVSKDGVVTITVGDGDDHEHLEMDSEHAMRLANVLSEITEWGPDAE
jgi:hypothetical protein